MSSSSTSLETYRDLIIKLYRDQWLNEEEIVQHLQEEEGLISDIFTLRTHLEKWHLITSPSPTYSRLDDPCIDAPYNSEQQYTPHENFSSSFPMSMNCYHDTYHHQSSILSNNLDTGPSPLETFTQDEQAHERLAIRLALLDSSKRIPGSGRGVTRVFRQHKIRKGEKGRQKDKGEKGEGEDRGVEGSRHVGESSKDRRTVGARRSK